MIFCTGKIKRSSNVVCRISWRTPTSLQENLTRSKFKKKEKKGESSSKFFHLILGSHLIRHHLKPCDEVPVDDCPTLAFVLQKPFTVVCHIIPLTVFLPLKRVFFRKWKVFWKVTLYSISSPKKYFYQKWNVFWKVTLYSHWGRSPRGDLKPKGVFIFSNFPLLQTLQTVFLDLCSP